MAGSTKQQEVIPAQQGGAYPLLTCMECSYSAVDFARAYEFDDSIGASIDQTDTQTGILFMKIDNRLWNDGGGQERRRRDHDATALPLR